MFLLQANSMKQTTAILAICSLSIFCSCDPDPDVQYMYIQPESVVYDTASGRAIDNSEVTLRNLLVHVKTPYSQKTVFEPATLPFVTKSYAMYKKEGRAFSVEKVKALRIITLKNYDATHPAGSDVADVCLFYNVKGNADSNKANPLFGDTTSVKQIISDMNVSEYYSGAGIYMPLRNEFVFRLAQPPASTSVQQFKIEFETATPSKFSTTTKQFTLKP